VAAGGLFHDAYNDNRRVFSLPRGSPAGDIDEPAASMTDTAAGGCMHFQASACIPLARDK
jgi:hypothetical protein